MSNTIHDAETTIWRQRWFQALLGVLIVAAVAVLVVPPVLALMYAVRPVLLPVLIGLALAYTMNPMATWLHRRWRVPRPVTAVGMMVAVVMIVVGLLAYLGPKLYGQATLFVSRLPTYAHELADYFDLDLNPIIERIEVQARELLATDDQQLDIGAIGAAVWRWLDMSLGVIGTTIGVATYLSVAVVVIAFCFFFFLWKFDGIVGWFVPFIPVSRRKRVTEIVGKMDQSVSAFIRGRLIQATVVAVVLSVGWWWVNVPYWLLLGVGAGILNLIPYAAVVGWPIAIGLTWLDTMTGGLATEAANGAAGVAENGDALANGGFDIWRVFIWPSAVYLLAQGLDGWVVEPIVQGQATNLDPLTVLLVVLLGGSLLGLLGLLIAIPAAACIKIFAKEVLIPHIKQWATTN